MMICYGHGYSEPREGCEQAPERDGERPCRPLSCLSCARTVQKLNQKFFICASPQPWFLESSAPAGEVRGLLRFYHTTTGFLKHCGTGEVSVTSYANQLVWGRKGTQQKDFHSAAPDKGLCFFPQGSLSRTGP